ncbi:MAG: class I SAM-dependent methyltransferase [Erysipelotrichaceae bacterium]
MKHYFTDNRELPSDRKEISFRFLGYDYRFVSDAGVFSKGEADEGSLLLVKTVLEEPLQSPLLDLGCGWGLMSLLLKHTRPQLQIVGTDINPRAIECARETSLKLNLPATFLVGDGTSALSDPFQTVILNPPIRAGKDVVYRLFQESYDILTKSGCLYVVIRRQQGAASAAKELERIFGNVSRIALKRGFEVLKASK